MYSTKISRTLKTAAVAALVAGAYLAGAAQGANTEAVARLNQSADLLTKAKALLSGSGTNRQGYGNVEKAKTNIDNALTEISKAVTANGG